RFEELCFDLLVKYQFYSLVWRQGGADSGRDIEANFTASNSLTGQYTEKWYIECKHHKKGLEIIDMNTKIRWETVCDIDHFILITTSYLTKSTREWINAKCKSFNFRVHLIEGKELKSRLLQFPELVNMYFLDDYLALVKSAYRNWVTHNIWL